jgi:hypothetical protein
MKQLQFLIGPLVMGLGIQYMGASLTRVKEAITRSQMKTAVKLIRLHETGEEPMLKFGDRGFAGYLHENLACSRSLPGLDSWGRPFRAYFNGRILVLVSDGPDGQKYTQDDIRESLLIAKR